MTIACFKVSIARQWAIPQRLKAATLAHLVTEWLKPRSFKAVLETCSMLLLFVTLCSPPAFSQTAPRVFEITADHDSRYRMAGHTNPTLTLDAGEHIILRITAVKAKSMNRDGAIHGFVLLDKNDEKVPGWLLSLQPGTHDFELIAPDVPGNYRVVCNVICSSDHESMHMNVKVLPNRSALEISR